jgi:hypothetical protein
MAKNVTYYFGAGASAQAIPVIDGLGKRILDLSLKLEGYLQKNHNQDSIDNICKHIWTHQDTLIVIIEDLKWLYKESQNHQTVDTLARKFYVQNEEKKLKQLKRALITYFYFEQHIEFGKIDDKGEREFKSKVDKRYDSLIATICDKDDLGNVIMKDNVKIISWNYDLQIDLCLMNFSQRSLGDTKIFYNIHPNSNSYNSNEDILFGLDTFGVLKLNGNAYFDATQAFGDHLNLSLYNTYIEHSKDDEIIGKFLLCFNNKFPNGRINDDDSFKYFNFAWEKNNIEKYSGHSSVIKTALQVASKTDILIIVGYSFPFFNSKIDRMILENMSPKEIIIQDSNPKLIESRLRTLIPKFDYDLIDFKLFEVDKYYPIPNEI